MTAAIFAGAAVGAGTALVSEIMLRYWMSRPNQPVLKILLRGMLLRAVLVLASLVIVLSKGWFEEMVFTASLVVSYLVFQVWEGFRYQRFIHSR